SFMKVLSMSSIDVAAQATVVAPRPEKSCVLAYDSGQPLSDTGMNFSGAPSVSLSGCSVRSNTSMSCSGHNGNATTSIAAGANASGCSNPQTNARVIPDIYARLADNNITPVCGLLHPGLTWDASVSTIPTGVRVVTNATYNYTEYHVCGDLTLTGAGPLTNSQPTADSVILIENGGLTVANSASVSTVRTTIVLTGSSSSNPSVIDFPNGNGQSATLSLSPPLTAGNPWQGVALY